MSFKERFSNWVTAIVPVGIAAQIAPDASPAVGTAQLASTLSMGLDPRWYPVAALLAVILLAEVTIFLIGAMWMPMFSSHRRWLGRWVSLETSSGQVSLFEIRWNSSQRLILNGKAHSFAGVPQERWDSNRLFSDDSHAGVLDYAYNGADLSGGQRAPTRIVGFCRMTFTELCDGRFQQGHSEFHESHQGRPKSSQPSAAVGANLSTVLRINRALLSKYDVWHRWIPIPGLGLVYDDKQLIAAIARASSTGYASPD